MLTDSDARCGTGGASIPGKRLMLCQAVQVDARKAGTLLLAPSGASGSREEHAFGWRDAMDIIVKWRQLSEPNDQVPRLQASL